jgi:hypothetical protein
MHIQHKIHRQDHKSKVNTCKHRYLVVPRIAASRASSGAELRITVGRVSSGVVEEIDKVICGSSEATCEGYRMSKRVDRKVESKIKSLESEHIVYFFLTPVSLVKEWH